MWTIRGSRVEKVLVGSDGINVIGIRFKNCRGKLFDVSIKNLEAVGLTKQDLIKYDYDYMLDVKGTGRLTTQDEYVLSLNITEFVLSKSESSYLLGIIRNGAK